MKKWVLGVGALLIAAAGYSQTWAEWFQQKKTQIRYLQEQIVALQAYIEAAQKGYAIYRDGLHFIGDLKQGDLDLHQNYFSSLVNVKSSIGQSAAVREVYQWQQDIDHIGQHWQKTNNPETDAYITQVFASLTVKADYCAQETKLLTSDRHYQLTDEQRMKRITTAHDHMREYDEFAKWMQQQAAVVASGYRQDQRDGHIVQQLSDIP